MQASYLRDLSAKFQSPAFARLDELHDSKLRELLLTVIPPGRCFQRHWESVSSSLHDVGWHAVSFTIESFESAAEMPEKLSGLLSC